MRSFTLLTQVSTADLLFQNNEIPAIGAYEVHDDDTPGLEILRTSWDNGVPLLAAPIKEGEGMLCYAVKLRSKPLLPVTVAMSSTSGPNPSLNDQLRIALADNEFPAPSTLNFREDATLVLDRDNWNANQHFVFVKAFEDYVAETQPLHFGAVQHSLSSLDIYYDAVPDVQVRVRIFETDMTLPPQLVNAFQSDTSETVWVILDLPAYTLHSPSSEWRLDQASTEVPCTSIFTNTVLASVNCRWGSECKKIGIMFGAPLGAELLSGTEKLVLKTGTLKPSATAILSSAGAIGVRPRPSPPRLMSAHFGNTGATARVQFDKGTNQGGQPRAGGPCANIFSNANLLGMGSVCTWPSTAGLQQGQTLVITFGQGATLGVYSLLHLKAGAVRSPVSPDGVQSLSVSSGAVSVSAPLGTTVKASAKLRQPPSEISSCDNLVLDASTSEGNAGRPMLFQWSVVTTSPQLPLLEDFLALKSNTQGIGSGSNRVFCGDVPPGADTPGVITIPSCLLVPGYVHSFSLTASNFLSDDTDTVKVQVAVASLPVPKIWFSTGSSLVMKSSESKYIRVNGQSSACGSADDVGSKIIYTWRGSSAVQVKKSTSCQSSSVDLGDFEDLNACLSACVQRTGCAFFT
jgi:hypothetical protein